MAFCDFCQCENCQTGNAPWSDYYHAQTDDGRWICDVCYTYDLCTADGPNRNWDGPCEDKDCEHRPKLVSEWTVDGARA